jgi:hypothetical protein
MPKDAVLLTLPSIKDKQLALSARLFPGSAVTVRQNHQAIGGYATAPTVASKAATPHAVVAKIDKPVESHARESSRVSQEDKFPAKTASESVSHDQIDHAVAEFFDVQRKFHDENSTNINNLLSLTLKIPEDERLYYLHLLEPYQLLGQNPFNAKATGDLEADLQHIHDVVIQRASFRQTLCALRDSTSNLPAIQSELEKLQKDKNFAAEIKRIQPSPLKLANTIYSPFRHLLRYVLLLDTIQGKLKEAGYQPTDNALKLVTQTIENIAPKVLRMNECKEVLDSLNHAERAMYILSSQVAMKISTSDQRINDAELVYDMFLGVMGTLKNLRDSIMFGGDDIVPLLEGALAVLEEAVRVYNDCPNSWYDYVYSVVTNPLTLFSADTTNQDPVDNSLAELNLVVDKIKELKRLREVKEILDMVKVDEVSKRARAQHFLSLPDDDKAKQNYLSQTPGDDRPAASRRPSF